MNFEKIKKFIKDKNIPKYRLMQIRDDIYKRGVVDWNDIKVLPKDLRQDLEKKFKILSVSLHKMVESKKDKVKKAVLKLHDGLKIETVLMDSYGVWSVCVSTQVGCALACKFCQTGQMGFKRNLTAEEITDQVLFWESLIKKQDADARVGSVVFMGMGEPLLNYAETIKAVNILSDNDYFNIGQRHISISTSGISDKIKKLATDLPQVNLAVSLHFAEDKLRNKYMPINRKYNLLSLKKALEDYMARTSRQVFVEYIVIGGVNDTKRDIRKLGEWIDSIQNKYLIHVNLIPANKTKNVKQKAEEEIIKELAKILKHMKISVSTRKSLGGDIEAACGQLIS